MLLLLLGIILGAGPFGWLYYREQKRSQESRERAELFQQEKLVVVEFIHGMVEALSQGLDKDSLYQRIVHAAVVSTGGVSACVYEMSPKGVLKSVAVEGLFPPHTQLKSGLNTASMMRSRFIEEAMQAEEIAIGEGFVGEVARTGRALLIEDASNDDRITQHADPALVVYTMIGVPISFAGKLIGVLAVCNTADGEPFSVEDFAVVQSLGEQAGLAVHHNEFLTLQVERKQIDLDLALARQIQQMLLPRRMPKKAGCKVNGRYVSSHSIGGDLYDVIDLGEGRIGIAVADVSGKGIAGAMLMAVCRTHLRNHARGERSPAAVLKAVNHEMTGDIKKGLYITIIYAVIDLQQSSICYARAGHEKPLICRCDSKRGLVETDFPVSEGMPIGLFPRDMFDEALEEICLPFGKGDIFVAFTDGLTEAANGLGKEFSSGRLADIVKAQRSRLPSQINELVLRRVKDFSGRSVFEDDVTLVTLKRDD